MKRIGDKWLSLTPEPEEELPVAIAVLRGGENPTWEEVALERSRAERLVVRGSRRGWERWLAEARGLAHGTHGGETAGRVQDARTAAIDVISNHDALKLGLTNRAGRGGRGGRGR